METNENTPIGGEVTETPQNQEAKMFDQAGVDEIVKSRLSREKEKYEKQISVLNNELSDVKTRLLVGEKEGEALSTVLESLQADLDPEKLSLIPESLPTHERISYIVKNKKFLSKQTQIQSTTEPVDESKKPNLPPSDRKSSTSTTGLYGGKYATLREFAEHDKPGYKEWAKNNPYKP
jgi:hypothetical protein